MTANPQLVTFGSKVRITDPCYARGTWCAGVVDVVPGLWHAAAKISDQGDWGKRNSHLMAWHESITRGDLPEEADSRWKLLKIDVGVLTGQAGFFTDEHYVDAETNHIDFDNPQTFYDRCCQATLNYDRWGVIDGHSVVSSSGFGDGSYSAFALKNDEGQVVALMLVFISDLEEEEEAA